MSKPIVIIESPFRGATPEEAERNLTYLRAALRDSLKRGEAPFASHGLYAQIGVLDDEDPAERNLGIDAGFAFRYGADKTIVYTDLGVSPGMRQGIEHARLMRCPIEYRTLPEWSRP